MFQRFKSFVLSLSREFSLQLTIDNSFISIESLIHLHKKLLQNAFALEMTVTIIIIDQYASEEHFSYSSEFSSAFKKKKQIICMLLIRLIWEKAIHYVCCVHVYT